MLNHERERWCNQWCTMMEVDDGTNDVPWERVNYKPNDESWKNVDNEPNDVPWENA